MRTLAETRQRLLETGLRLLKERGIDVGVAHIRLSEVTAAAGYTVTAGYRCWDNQAAFHRELALAAIQRRSDEPIGATVRAIRDLVDARAPLAEVIRVAAEANLFRYPDNSEQLNTLTLRTCGPLDEELAKAGREHLTTTVESFATLYSTLLPVYRLRIRQPFTISDLTLALLAVTEGFAVQAMSGDPHPRVRRSDSPAGVDDDWSLFACTVEAVVEKFTEPIGQAR